MSRLKDDTLLIRTKINNLLFKNGLNISRWKLNNENVGQYKYYIYNEYEELVFVANTLEEILFTLEG